MWLHNELFCAVDDQPIMQFQNLIPKSCVCFIFLETQCERDDNQMRDDWNKYNHSGEVFSRGQMFFLFHP